MVIVLFGVKLKASRITFLYLDINSQSIDDVFAEYVFRKVTYNYTSDLYVDIIVLKSTLKTGFYVLFTDRCYQLFGPLNTDKSKHLVISV